MIKVEEAMKKYDIKESTLNALYRYVEDKTPTGDFLHAVLTNNLCVAIGRADPENMVALKEIMKFCHNEIRMDCYGSPKVVKDWLSSEK